MAATSSPAPMLFSVLTSSHDNHDDFVYQLRNHLTQIENNVQETLNKIQQRILYKPIEIDNSNRIDTKGRTHFFHVLKDVAINNNVQFDESFFRHQFLDKQDSSPSPKVDIVRAKPSITTDTNDRPQLSPINNNRRSQFAPVLSSTPVHQTSPIIPIPVDLTMATPSVAQSLTMNSNDLPTALPSAIVPQRANVTRPAGRPPRIPRGESVTRQKKNTSPIKEQNEETVLTKEIQITTKRRIKTKQDIIEDNIEVIIEQQTDIIPDIIKQVQATPLRGRKKKIIQDDINIIPQLEPPPLPPPDVPVEETENIPKKTRVGRNKKKQEEEDVEDNKPKRTASVRNRKKKKEDEEEEKAESPKDVPVASKKAIRNKKTVEPVANIEETLPPPPPATKVRATPSRGKKKSPIETVITSPPKLITPPTPKKTTKSKKRKDTSTTNENPTDTIQPPSPKRRGGRNTKSKNNSPVEPMITPPLIEQQEQPPALTSTRSSRRGKKDIEIPIEKQETIVLNKKSRTGRGKKLTEPNNTDIPVTVVDIVMTSVTVSAPVPSTTDSKGAKPPRPPVARKKKSIAMPPVSQMSPSTPPSTKRIPSTSPINDKPLLPIPVPKSGGRRRQQQRRLANSPNRVEESTLEIIPSVTRNQKRTQSSVMSTPKRARRDNLIVTTVPSTPGKKRNKCTCEKRRHRICDICATAAET